MRKPIVYECIHIWITKRSYPVMELKREDIFRILGELFHIPKEERHKVIKELIDFKFIKQLNRNSYQVLN